jgi:hypothetical protein
MESRGGLSGRHLKRTIFRGRTLSLWVRDDAGPLIMVGTDELGYVNRYGLSRKVSWPRARGLARPGLTLGCLAHLRVGEGQLEETGRRLHRRFAMPQVIPPTRMLIIRGNLSYQRLDPDTPIEETVRLFPRPNGGKRQVLTESIKMQALHDVVKAGHARYIGISSCYA